MAKSITPKKSVKPKNTKKNTPIKAKKAITKTSSKKTISQKAVLKKSIKENKVDTTAPAKISNSKKRSQRSRRLFTKNTLAHLLIAAGIGVLLYSGYTWYQKVYSSPTNVFWGMVDNNLRTRGILRTISNSTSSGSITQRTQYSFGADLNVHTTTDIVQGEDVIKAETAGYRDTSLARYVEYKPKLSEGRKVPDLSKVLGKWGDLSGGQAEQSARKDQYLYDALLVSSLLPFGDLAPLQRSELVKFMRDQIVLDPNVAYVRKDSKDGRSVYVYQVIIDNKKQALLIKKYADIMKLDFDPSESEQSGEITIEMMVDVRSRNLLSISSPSSSYTQTFSDYGSVVDFKKPTADMTLEQLQASISGTE